MYGLFQFLHCQTWRQGLFQILHFLFVYDEQIGVKVYAASNFKLHVIFVFIDLDRFSIFLPDCKQKVFDFPNFERHGDEVQRAQLEQGVATSKDKGKVRKYNFKMDKRNGENGQVSEQTLH